MRRALRETALEAWEETLDNMVVGGWELELKLSDKYGPLSGWRGARIVRKRRTIGQASSPV